MAGMREWQQGFVEDLGEVIAEQQGWRPGLKVYGIVAALAVLILAAAAVFAAIVDIPGSTLTREPQVTLGGAVYAGALSNLGALVWMIGVVMATVGWWLTERQPLRQAFLAGAIVGAILLIDDFFLFHDWVRTHSLVLDRALLAVYMLLVVGLIVRYWQVIGGLATAGLVTAFGLLSLSALLDFFFNALDQLVEDGFKFVGICLWATSWSVLALANLQTRQAPIGQP